MLCLLEADSTQPPPVRAPARPSTPPDPHITTTGRTSPIPPLTLLHRRLITLAVEDYAPGYYAPLQCACAAYDAARYVAAYDLPPLVPVYGLKALEHAADTHIQQRPELLERTPAECAARHAAREREGQRLATAAVAAHRAGDPQRAALLIDDAQLINPRADWSRYRGLLPATPKLAAAG